MNLPLETLLTRLDQLQDTARALASLLDPDDSFETSWEVANRICDRYHLPRLKPLGSNTTSKSPWAA
jgi:hypothetical protein